MESTGSNALVWPHTEAVRPLMEAPHAGRMEEEADQTMEAD